MNPAVPNSKDNVKKLPIPTLLEKEYIWFFSHYFLTHNYMDILEPSMESTDGRISTLYNEIINLTECVWAKVSYIGGDTPSLP